MTPRSSSLHMFSAVVLLAAAALTAGAAARIGADPAGEGQAQTQESARQAEVRDRFAAAGGGLLLASLANFGVARIRRREEKARDKEFGGGPIRLGK